MMKHILLLLIVATAQAIPATAQSREKALDPWFDKELIPYVRQQLVKHPRFKDETVMFVVLNDNYPAPSSNALALKLRDRLLEAAVRTSAVSIGWQQGHNANSAKTRADDCLQDSVRYYIGIELTQELNSRYSINLRALDLEDKTWVAGFGKRWQGNLSTIQRQAMRQQRVDETFLGARDVPFMQTQTDLLATHLAQQLSCTLKQPLSGDYVVHAASATGEPKSLEGTFELISNNLTSHQALMVSSDKSRTNATLRGKAHRIDGLLHQYWLTLTPNQEVENLAALSASAYIVLPDENSGRIGQTTSTNLPASPVRAHLVQSARTRPTTISVPNAGQDALLGQLRIASAGPDGSCRQPCSSLRSEAAADVIIFVLQHQVNDGLVRLSGGACRQRAAAKLVRAGDTLNFPVTAPLTPSSNAVEQHEWELQPAADTFYAIAVSDAQVARQIANHIDALPLRCAATFRPGLSGDDLHEWLSEFAMRAAKASAFIDWRALQIRDVT